MNKELKEQLESEGYRELVEIPGRGICGLMGFIFTVGLCYGIDAIGYEGRYCYSHADSFHAVLALKEWDGINDPNGKWIKHKGKVGEWGNMKS
jgi:hypothetical protein